MKDGGRNGRREREKENKQAPAGLFREKKRQLRKRVCVETVNRGRWCPGAKGEERNKERSIPRDSRY